MKKNNILLVIIFVFGLFASPDAFAQKAKVDQKLKEYDIPDDFFMDNLSDENANHSVKLKTTTITSDETKVEEGYFDPTLNDGERWQLISVNGKTPTSKEIKQYHKAHNTSEDSDFGAPEDEDWKIIEDNNSELIIEFRYRKENLPHKYKFLAQCIGKVSISKIERRLEKVEFYNTEPVKIKIFNVDKLDMIVFYTLDKETKTYLIEKEDVQMDARILGQTVQIKEINEFYEYKKVR